MADYYLQDDLLVEERNHGEFEDLVGNFLTGGGFSKYGWRLILALRTAHPLEHESLETRYRERYRGKPVTVRDSRSTNAASARVYRYVHLWDVPDPPDIANVMQQSADDSRYTRINRLVRREIQNQMLRVDWLSTPTLSNAARRDFLFVTKHFRSRDLGPYLFNMGALIPALEHRGGWHSLGHFQNVTGPLNTLSEYWQVPPEGTEPGAMEAVLDALPEVVREEIVDPVKNAPLAELREPMLETPYSH